MIPVKRVRFPPVTRNLKTVIVRKIIRPPVGEGSRLQPVECRVRFLGDVLLDDGLLASHRASEVRPRRFDPYSSSSGAPGVRFLC